MAKIGAFDPGIGLVPLRDGRMEIGRSNLPGAARLLPGGAVDVGNAPIFGRLSQSSVMDMLAPLLALDIGHRELLSPDVFFAAVDKAASDLRRLSLDAEEPGRSTLADAADQLDEVMLDKDLLATLRGLVVRA